MPVNIRLTGLVQLLLIAWTFFDNMIFMSMKLIFSAVLSQPHVKQKIYLHHLFKQLVQGLSV